MSTNVDNQYWDSYKADDRHRARRLGDAQIAEAHSTAKQQQLTKDIYLPASIAKDIKEAPWEKVGVQSQKLELPEPWKAFGNQDEETPGLIAIISAAVIAQEKSSSNIWSTLWKQASESMMQQVSFAPIIGNAIKSSYTAMSMATQQDADQARADGIINFGGFAVSMLAAGMMEYKEGEQPMKNSEESGITDEMPKNEEPPNQAVNDLKQRKPNLNPQDIKSGQPNFFRRGWNRFKKTMEHGKHFTGFLAKLNSNAVQSIQLLSHGTQGIVDSGYQTKKASYQAQQGVQDAISKESEQYAQFFGQDFSRTDSLGNATQQYFEFGAQTIKSAADTITQTVTSMFRS